jgi:hypothetical protein
MKAAKQWDCNRRRYVSIKQLDKSNYDHELVSLWLNNHQGEEMI